MIKYYGGKTWLPKYLEKNLPKDNNIETFIDLFVGGECKRFPFYKI